MTDPRHMKGHISEDKFRSTQAIMDDLSKQHERDRLRDKANKEANDKLVYKKAKRRAELDDLNLPANATYFRRQAIANDEPSAHKVYVPTHKELLTDLTAKYHLDISALKDIQNAATERLAILHRYNVDKRQLLRMREQGLIRIETS